MRTGPVRMGVVGFLASLLSAVTLYAQDAPSGALQTNGEGELSKIDEELTSCTNDLAQCTESLSLCRGQCGNGVAEFQEQCDGPDRRSQTCNSLSKGALPYGLVGCTSECTWDMRGCTIERFVNNRDGTITDQQTRLMWEQKTHEQPSQFHRRGHVPRFEVGDPCVGLVHWVDGACTWFETTTAWVTRLNQQRFAGYTDWRVPTVSELVTLVDYRRTNPALDPIFAIATDDGYWSATEVSADPDHAWVVDYITGRVFFSQKTLKAHVRAVRGGF